MILDKVGNKSRNQFRQNWFENFKGVVSSPEYAHFQKGRFDIHGEEIFGIGLEYETKKAVDCIWEAHQKHIDVHLILEGEEKVFVSDRDNMKVLKPYDKIEDYELFEGKKEQEIILRSGTFLVLYPNEVHKTGITTSRKSTIKKIVFKVRINE